MDMPFDFKAFMATINKFIKGKTDIAIISQGTQARELPYPFFTYDEITPHQNLGFTDNVNYEVFEMVLEFDAHCLGEQPSDPSLKDKPPFGANGASNLSNYLSKLLQTEEFYELGKQNNFYIVGEPGDISSTTNLISIQVERSAGFQARFRVQDNFSDNVKFVDNINKE